MWHYRHMMDPRSVTQNSIMPPYPWLKEKKIDFTILKRKVAIMKNLGVPYSDQDSINADEMARVQAAEIAKGLEDDSLKDKEIVALVAYLQSLGKQSQGEE